MWEIVKKMPHLFQFGISYIENPDGTFELIGISLIRAFPNPLRNLDTPPKQFYFVSSLFFCCSAVQNAALAIAGAALYERVATESTSNVVPTPFAVALKLLVFEVENP